LADVVLVNIICALSCSQPRRRLCNAPDRAQPRVYLSRDVHTIAGCDLATDGGRQDGGEHLSAILDGA
jgi:hypothetical protein